MTIEFKQVLLVDSHHGQYIPQVFAETVKRDLCKGISQEQWDILESGPENELYWDVMTEIENTCEIVSEGDTYTLYYNGDLWAISGDVPEDFYDY